MPSVDAAPPLAGWNGSFYIRDRKDYFRIYPKLRLMLDFTAPFSAGLSKVAAADGATALKPRFFLRRLEVEMGGEFLKRWTFDGSLEITQPISNGNGKAELSAAGAGATPTADTARFQPVEATTAGVQPADVWIDYRAAPWLNFMFGQYQAPVSMENRTGNKTTSFMERSVAIRSFVVPNTKEMGLTVWGEIGDKVVNYELGVFSGDGQNRTQIDGNADFMGRVFLKPFSGNNDSMLRRAQIGLSGRHGDRDPKYVGYDYAAITTASGVTLWSPSYKDSLGRNIHVIPSSGQNTIGGEIRLPISKLDLRGEAYYVANNTREAVEGFQLTNTERYGQVRGVGFYGQLSVWLGDAYVSGEPGLIRPTRIDFTKEPDAPKRGIEVLALISGISATYDGASRADTKGTASTYDAKTPGNPTTKTASNINVMQYAFGFNYWHSSYIRTTVNYSIYHTPGSGTADNMATVPGNTLKAPNTVPDAHVVHELGARLALAF